MKKAEKLHFVIRSVSVFLFLVSSFSGLCQNISLKADSLSLLAVIQEVEEQTDVRFAYDPNLITRKYVSVNLNQIPLGKALPVILSGTDICYKESGQKHYLLFPCARQKWHIQGSVHDRQTGEQLPFADVRIASQPLGVVADRNGRFRLNNLTTDSIELMIYYIGYHPQKLHVHKHANESVIYLDRLSELLGSYEVDVYTEVVNAGEYFGRLTINSDLLKGMPSLGEPDPIKSIKLLPGVGGNAETSTGIAMRGGKFDQTMILYDDFQLLHVDHFFGLFSTVNQNMVKNIQVYRSGYSSKYSGFTSGLVQIVGKDGNAKQVAGGFATNVYSSSAYLEVPVIKEKWSTALSFRRDNAWLNHTWWSDGIVLPHIENEIRTKTPSSAEAEDTEGNLHFDDFSFKTKYRLNNKNEITLSTFRSSDRVSTVYNNSIDDEEELISILELSSQWNNDGISFKWAHKPNTNYSAELIYTYSKFDNATNFDRILEVIDDDTLDDISDIGFSNSFTQEHYRYDAEWKRKKSVWLFGTDITLFRSRFTSVEDGEEFTDNFTKTLPAIYIENERTIKDNLKWLIGTRLTYEDENAQLYVEPRLSMFYAFNKRLKSTVSYGLYYQHAKQYVPDERDGLIPDYWLLPDYELTFPTRAHIASIGLTYNKRKWMVNAEVFYKNYDQTSEQFPSISDLIESNADFVKVLSTGNGTVIGGDVVLRKRFKKSSTWMGIGLNRVRNSSDSIEHHEYQPYYTNFGDLKLGYLYSWKKWEGSLTWTWLGGRMYTNLEEGISQLSDADVGNSQLPDYHRLDASLSYKLKINKLDGAIRATVFNVYNRQNVRTINFTQLDSAPNARPQAIPVSTLGTRPNLTLEINF